MFSVNMCHMSDFVKIRAIYNLSNKIYFLFIQNIYLFLWIVNIILLILIKPKIEFVHKIICSF
uniref:Uncharacterized protein n=1 Tax=Timema tahoe TaxID=61484 RepID=A0A7R9ILW4_9NEOP|nr:unnamed protein product [Timema tahoe]